MKNKLWILRTWGGGTPVYLISAPDRTTAYHIASYEWRKKYSDYYIGGHHNPWTGKYEYQDESYVKDTGFTTDSPTGVVDVYEL